MRGTHRVPPQRTSWLTAHAAVGSMLAAAVFLLAPSPARAVPSYARQMDMQCIACHTEFPVLNSFGRQFKLSGYTSSANNTDMPPIAFMFQPSFTHTAKAQEGGAAPDFSDNDNFALTQASIFYAGRLFGPFIKDPEGTVSPLNKIGIFCQITYDGIEKAWAWDNTELRYADTGTIAGQDAIWGVYLNNNPTMQDPYNSTPAWGFPFTGSGLAPGPSAVTMIEDTFGGTAAGLGAYAMLNSTYYIDVGAYRTLGYSFQKSMGVDPADDAEISGVAPYWRFAFEKMDGNARWEVGTFGMAASTYPGRDHSEGTDRVSDIGLDAQYQTTAGADDITAMVSWIYETQHWDASYAMEDTQNPSDSLWDVKATFDYLHDKTYGATLQYFIIDGSSDTGLYADAASGSPKSSGFVLQANYLPFNKDGGPKVWPRSNVKLSLQYTYYTQLDGLQASASDNNTLYAEAWIAF